MPFLLFLLLLMSGCSVLQPTVVRPVKSSWQSLPGWPGEEVSVALRAFIQSCQVLQKEPAWSKVCSAAQEVKTEDPAAPGKFFEQYFFPYRLMNQAGDEGLVTGYYEPLLKGSLNRSDRFRFPLFGIPRDLVTVDLSSIYPELKNFRLRGRLEGNRLVPYFSRGEISRTPSLLAGSELLWVDDPVELFFLQIQGSGKILLPDGKMLSVGFADQNGYPYRSIGKLLVERGELTLAQASMAGIKEWARKNPAKRDALLAENPSFVFFRILPDNLPGPPGALGVPLTPGRSIAVDPRSIPLGAPVYLSTTWPESTTPLSRLMLAQDTGGAIKGAVRADFFWGFGEKAGEEAGKMKERAKMWMLLPKDYPPP